jgi:hypothetical protein
VTRGWPVALAAILALAALLAALTFAVTGPQGLAFAGSGSFGAGHDYAGIAPGGIRGPRFGTWDGDDGKRGRGVSAPFAAPVLFALQIAGGTARPDETIVLRREDGGGTLRIGGGADAGERYATAALVLPRGWWGRPVRLIVEDRGGGPRGWLGVAGSGRAVLPRLLAGDRAAFLALIVLQAALLGIPAVVLGGWIAARLRLGGDAAPFAAGLVAIGLLAEAAYFAARFTPLAGAAGALAEAAALAATALVLAGRGKRRVVPPGAAWTPLVLATAVALVYGALLGAAAPADDDVLTAASAVWMHLPGDNVLPQLLARQAETHAPPRPFSGDWLSSDRPPLQAGFAVVSDAVLPFAGAGARYEAVALWLQALAFGGMWCVARALGATPRRALAGVVLCVPAGVLLINAVFTWPKLLAAALGCAALALALAPGASRRARYALAGAALGLGMLAHPGVAFTVPGLAGALAWRERRAALACAAVALAAAAIAYAPWVAYQRFYDPPGDRLLKWHLAGSIAVEPEVPLTTVLARAYGAKTPAQILAAKADNVRTLVHAQYGDRAGEFFYVLTALGALALPLLALALLWPVERGALALVAIAAGGLLFWCLTKWSGTVIHEGSYLTLVLLFLAGALVATRRPALAWALGAVQTASFAAVWLAGVVQPLALAFELLGIAACAVALAGLTSAAVRMRARERAAARA